MSEESKKKSVNYPVDFQTLPVIRASPLTLGQRPPQGAANNCGHPASLSWRCLGAKTLSLAGVPPSYTGWWQQEGSSDTIPEIPLRPSAFREYEPP